MPDDVGFLYVGEELLVKDVPLLAVDEALLTLLPTLTPPLRVPPPVVLLTVFLVETAEFRYEAPAYELLLSVFTLEVYSLLPPECPPICVGPPTGR